MARQPLEVADIFRDHGPAWREANRGHLSHGQLKVMSAIERCRTAALGGHVSRCESCEHTEIAYNSCRNRHCPKCQGAAAKQWLAARESELLPVSYFHVVFTVPTQIGDIAYQNKAIVYNLLFKAAAETLLTIGADPKHLGALLGLIAVLHTWGSAMTHHPHLHFIVPGGGLSLDGDAWVSSRDNFLVHVKVLSALFRPLSGRTTAQSRKTDTNPWCSIRLSLSVASSSTSYHPAFTAFAITASSPMDIVHSTSTEHDDYSALKQLMTATTMMTLTIHRPSGWCVPLVA